MHLNSLPIRFFAKLADSPALEDCETMLVSCGGSGAVSANHRYGPAGLECFFFEITLEAIGCIGVLRRSYKDGLRVQIGLQFSSGGRVLLDGYIINCSYRVFSDRQSAVFALDQMAPMVRFAP